MNPNALTKIGYGLYVITVNDNNKDNGCIINTVMQVTSNPCMLAFAVNKCNYTCEIIQKSKKVNISILTEETNFDTIKNFGYQSGKENDKFSTFSHTKRSPNGVLYITKNTNAYFSVYVKQELDLGSHILFIAQPVAAEVLSDKPTLTYDYYQNNIKPKPQELKINGWRCKICGFIYEHETLPSDYICPICKHGSDDFEKI